MIIATATISASNWRLQHGEPAATAIQMYPKSLLLSFLLPWNEQHQKQSQNLSKLSSLLLASNFYRLSRPQPSLVELRPMLDVNSLHKHMYVQFDISLSLSWDESWATSVFTDISICFCIEKKSKREIRRIAELGNQEKAREKRLFSG